MRAPVKLGFAVQLCSHLFDNPAAKALPAGLLQSFIQNGVISGVGNVIVWEDGSQEPIRAFERRYLRDDGTPDYGD